MVRVNGRDQSFILGRKIIQVKVLIFDEEDV